MKLLTRLVYSIAILVFGLGLYLAVKLRDLHGRMEQARTAATARQPGTIESRLTMAGPRDSGGPTPAARRPWLSDPKVAEQEWRRFVPPKSFDHKVANAIANQLRVRIRFAELYDLLGLDQEEIARFETAAAAAGLTFSPLAGASEESIASFREGQARSMDKVVAATLGADYVAVFRGFLQTSDLRLMASELAVNSFYSDTPLSASQAEQLIRICVENRDGSAAGPRIDPDSINWDTVTARAGEFLTPSQIQSLQAMVAKRRFDNEFKNVTGLPLRRPVRGL